MTLDLYEAELSELRDLDALTEAVSALIHSSRRFPSIAEVRDAYRFSERESARRRRDAERERADVLGLPRAAEGPRELPSEVVAFMDEHGWGDGILRSMPESPQRRGRRDRDADNGQRS